MKAQVIMKDGQPNGYPYYPEHHDTLEEGAAKILSRSYVRSVLVTYDDGSSTLYTLEEE